MRSSMKVTTQDDISESDVDASGEGVSCQQRTLPRGQRVKEPVVTRVSPLLPRSDGRADYLGERGSLLRHHAGRRRYWEQNHWGVGRLFRSRRSRLLARGFGWSPANWYEPSVSLFKCGSTVSRTGYR